MRKFLAVLVVLVGVFIAADRVAAAVADREVADRLTAAYALPTRPTVQVRGFPFLTQVASGNYREVTVSIRQVDSDGVQVDNLDVTVTGVHAPIGVILGHQAGGITANHVAADGTVPFSTVRDHLPAGVQVEPDGDRLRLSGTIGYLGVDVPVTTVASVTVTGSNIQVTPQTVTVGGGAAVPASVVAGRFTFVIPVTGLPLHLAVTSVAVTPSGVRVDAAANDVQFSGTG